MVKVDHNCGVVVAHSLHDLYTIMKGLQHRGKEAAGIAGIGDTIDVLKWIGKVNELGMNGLNRIFKAHKYHTFMGHVRYSTSGEKQSSMEDLLRMAHPHVIGGEFSYRGNHVLIRNCEAALVHNGQVDAKYLSELECKLQTDCDSESLLHELYENSERYVMRNVPGAYTLAFAKKRYKDVVVMRDRTGIKPGVLGWKDGKFCVASEDSAIKEAGGKFIEELDSGAIYYLKPSGNFSKEQLVDPEPKYCFFEYNYVASPESILAGVPVNVMRARLGKRLAQEFRESHPDVKFDVVTFLPECPEAAAKSFAKELGVLFVETLYKFSNSRAFQGPTTEDRAANINSNLHLCPGMDEYLRGKTVAAIEDSTVRGNNVQKERRLFYEEAGVKQAWHLNYTPPLCITGTDGVDRGCLFGVDMPPRPNGNDSYIARGRTVEQVSDIIGMPTYYLSVDGMLEEFAKSRLPPERLCTYCIGGAHPFEGL